jgi:hypothetical protein
MPTPVFWWGRWTRFAIQSRLQSVWAWFSFVTTRWRWLMMGWTRAGTRASSTGGRADAAKPCQRL